MASCIKNIRAENYQNLMIGFQVTVENVGDAFLGQRRNLSTPTDDTGTLHKLLAIIYSYIFTASLEKFYD